MTMKIPARLAPALLGLLAAATASIPAEAADASGASPAAAAAPSLSADLAWPAATNEQKPWTYWWWMGSAVDAKNITGLLTRYRDAGFGGVHVIPIYGAKGWEDRYLEYLSPAWMAALAHTVAEARRLGLGVDMTTGTGWPFGGPQVTDAHAAQKVELVSRRLSAGERLADKLGKGTAAAGVAIAGDGRSLDVTAKINAEGRLDWSPPDGAWEVFAVLGSGTGQNVKRAAPGGAGRVVDPFSRTALAAYLAPFDRAFDSQRGELPRAQYHDSYEYYGATWTPGLLAAFEKRRGYDLRRELPALFEKGAEDKVARVKSDYRETVADLLLEEFIRPWVDWCHSRGRLARNQAHGSPGNLLDLYAAADIPETEIFGPSGFPIPGLRTDPTFENARPDPLMLKFSSSAAHVAGRRLVSSETCTWLAEHFTVALSQAKPEIDQLFVCGVNHIFYHGAAYSPAEEPWPGWLFYASTSFAPTNPFWADLPALNAYIARCQSVLQAGSPANDILLYFPIHEIWHDPKGLVSGLSVHSIGSWLHGSRFHAAAKKLRDRGYTFDYISDRLLESAKASPDGIVAGGIAGGSGARYRALLIPSCRLLPARTAETIVALARGGASVLVEGSLPGDVPGWGDLPARREALAAAWRQVPPASAVAPGVGRSAVGSGAILLGGDIEALLASAGVSREPMADLGLSFIRRRHEEGHHYFIANLGAKDFGGWISLGTSARSAALLDPRLPGRSGVAAVRRGPGPGGSGPGGPGPDGSGPGGPDRVYLQLKSGESCVLRTFEAREIEGPAWRYLSAGRGPGSLPAALEPGPWQVEFLSGGPEIPPGFKTEKLASWTELGGPEAQRFAGTARYTASFELPPGPPGEWILDLGRVAESARVAINGKPAGTLFSLPLAMPVGAFLKEGRNEIQIDVTNLAANRIADMDRRGVPWKKFHDANIVDIRYKPFDASKWPLMPSGLLGPVRIVPAGVMPHDGLPSTMR
jgi:hypothetical protein